MLLHLASRQVGTEEQMKLVMLRSSALLKRSLLGSVCFQQRIDLNQVDFIFQLPCAICNFSLEKGNIGQFNCLLGLSISLIPRVSCEICTTVNAVMAKQTQVPKGTGTLCHGGRYGVEQPRPFCLLENGCICTGSAMCTTRRISCGFQCLWASFVLQQQSAAEFRGVRARGGGRGSRPIPGSARPCCSARPAGPAPNSVLCFPGPKCLAQMEPALVYPPAVFFCPIPYKHTVNFSTWESWEVLMYLNRNFLNIKLETGFRNL